MREAVAASEPPWACSSVLRCHQGPVLCLALDVDGEYLLSGGQDKMICLSKACAENGALLQKYEGHAWEILDIKVSNDHKSFASGGLDRTAIIWDVAAARPLRRLVGHAQRIHSVDLNDEATVAFTGSYDGTARVWDLRGPSRLPIQILEEAKDSISTVAVTQSQLLTGSMDGSIRIYDLRAGLLQTFSRSSAITHVTLPRPPPYSASQNLGDLPMALVSSADSTLSLYDLSEPPFVLLNVYGGHMNDKLKIGTAFSSDEKYILGCSEDGLIHVWDFMSAELRHRLSGHAHATTSIVSHPNQSVFFSASMDSSIRVWCSLPDNGHAP